MLADALAKMGPIASDLAGRHERPEHLLHCQSVFVVAHRLF